MPTQPYPLPEHEKLAKVKDESQKIGEFLEWLSEDKSYFIAQWYGHYADHISESKEKLLAEYFGIDLKKLSQEKEQMFAELVAFNEQREKERQNAASDV